MCIYYGTRNDLTYHKQEHIFPAGIGGIQKLDHGVVSDQANEFFSPLELKMMRSSIISVTRAFMGPGKRGSLSPNKTSKSRITVGKEENGDIVFSYLAKGTPYIVPCFMRDGKKIHLHLSPKDTASKTPENVRAEFIETLMCYQGEHISLASSYIPSGCLLIGYYDKQYYVASSEPNITSEQVVREISTLLRANKTAGITLKKQEHLTQDIRIEDGIDSARIFAKIAFNVLAYLKGKEYVTESRFDNIRNAILGDDNSSSLVALLPSARDDRVRALFPKDAHSCLIVQYNGKLLADVRLYGYWGRLIELGPANLDEFIFPDGFICDWQNRAEYRLMDYIAPSQDNCLSCENLNDKHKKYHFLKR